MKHARVLADIEGGELEPEGRDGAGGALEAPLGYQPAAVCEKRLAHKAELGDQLLGPVVVAARHVRAALGEPRRVFSSLTPMQVSLSR